MHTLLFEKVLKLVNAWLFSKVYSSSYRRCFVGFMKLILNGKLNVRKYLLALTIWH